MAVTLAPRPLGSQSNTMGVPTWGGNYGGAWGQRRKLLAGTHPKTGKEMGLSVGPDGRSVDHIMKGEGIYMNTAKARSDRLKETKQLVEAKPGGAVKMQPQGKSVKLKTEEMRQRVKAKENAKADTESAQSMHADA